MVIAPTHSSWFIPRLTLADYDRHVLTVASQVKEYLRAVTALLYTKERRFILVKFVSCQYEADAGTNERQPQ